MEIVNDCLSFKPYLHIHKHTTNKFHALYILFIKNIDITNMNALTMAFIFVIYDIYFLSDCR